MNFIGYLVTLANLHNFAGQSPNDMSIRVGPLQDIASEVRRLPGFDLDGFRQNGYQRVDNVGVYLSKNVQNYLFYDQGGPTEEGLMLTLFFSEPLAPLQEDRRTLFVHRKPVSDDVKQAVNEYAQSGKWPSQYVANSQTEN